MPFPILYQYKIPKSLVEAFSNERNLAHVYLMSAYPQGLGSSPRATIGLLWHNNPDSDLLLAQSTVPPLYPEKIGRLLSKMELPLPSAGEIVKVKLDIVCQKTPPSQVPEEIRRQVKSNRAEIQSKNPHLQLLGHTPKGSYRSAKILVPKEDRREWLSNRLEAMGLDVDIQSAQISDVRWAQISKQKGRLPYIRTQFEGRVLDQNLFQNAVTSGAGQGKNYGLALIRTGNLVD